MVADSDLGAGADAGVGLSNFLKSRVRVRRGAAIKKLLKIFLFIFFYILLSIFFCIMVNIYQFKSNGKHILIN